MQMPFSWPYEHRGIVRGLATSCETRLPPTSGHQAQQGGRKNDFCDISGNVDLRHCGLHEAAPLHDIELRPAIKHSTRVKWMVAQI